MCNLADAEVDVFVSVLLFTFSTFLLGASLFYTWLGGSRLRIISFDVFDTRGRNGGGRAL